MSNSLKIRHTESVHEKLKQAHTLLGITNKLSIKLGQIFNQWSRTRISDKQVLKLIQQAMAPSKEVLENVLNGKEDEHSTYFKNLCTNVSEYAFSNETQQTITTKGTLFGAYNAITGYFQNVREYKNEESKLKSIQFGNGLNKAHTAFKLCTQFEKNPTFLN